MTTPYSDGQRPTQGDSLGAQQAEIERYCEQQGHELVRTYADGAMPARTDGQRDER